MIEKQLLKGSLKSLILKLLKDKDRMYGYEITRTLEEMTGGSISLTLGALYPILHKLESEGDLITESEVVNNRVRVYYKLTRRGKQTADKKIEELRQFIETLGRFLKNDLNYAFS